MLSYNVFSVLTIILCSTTVLTSVLKEKRQTSCSRDAYRCKNGQCIESFSVCDGSVDCNDGSDETLALCAKSSLQCPSYAFRCAYGACVNKKSKCDGKRDCADNSDELLPECNSSEIKDSNCSAQEFPCNAGRCVDRFSLCDGKKDCTDGSDETITQCIAISCPSFSFKCAYGACIEKVKKCDGKKDCADGSDEDPDLCGRPSGPSQGRPTGPSSSAPPEKGSCRLPQTPEHGYYDVMGCRNGDNSAMCRKVAGTSVSPTVVLRYHCDEGHIITDVSRNLVCINGTWDPKPPKCLRLCEALESDSLELSCSYRGERVDCHKPARPGTIVHPNCRNAYHVQDPSSVFEHTTCGTNGRWAQQLFKCVPGKPPTPTPHIIVHIHNYFFLDSSSHKGSVPQLVTSDKSDKAKPAPEIEHEKKINIDSNLIEF